MTIWVAWGFPEGRCPVCGDRPVIPPACTAEYAERIIVSFRVSHAKCPEIVKERFVRSVAAGV